MRTEISGLDVRLSKKGKCMRPISFSQKKEEFKSNAFLEKYEAGHDGCHQ